MLLFVFSLRGEHTDHLSDSCGIRECHLTRAHRVRSLNIPWEFTEAEEAFVCLKGKQNITRNCVTGCKKTHARSRDLVKLAGKSWTVCWRRRCGKNCLFSLRKSRSVFFFACLTPRDGITSVWTGVAYFFGTQTECENIHGFLFFANQKQTIPFKVCWQQFILASVLATRQLHVTQQLPGRLMPVRCDFLNTCSRGSPISTLPIELIVISVLVQCF